VPGLMEDENNGVMIEFVRLKAKMYALRVDGKRDLEKTKDVKNSIVARTITFDDYTRCLNEEIEMTRRQSYKIKVVRSIYSIREEDRSESVRRQAVHRIPESTHVGTLPNTIVIY